MRYLYALFLCLFGCGTANLHNVTLKPETVRAAEIVQSVTGSYPREKVYRGDIEDIDPICYGSSCIHDGALYFALDEGHAPQEVAIYFRCYVVLKLWSELYQFDQTLALSDLCSPEHAF